MRSKLAALAFGFLVAAAALTPSTPAHADDTFDVSASSGTVTITTKSGWHINKDYPWKLISGDTKITKDSFTIGETVATVSNAPKGHATLKGAVCSGDQCNPFVKELDL
jgi:hypothetical protein